MVLDCAISTCSSHGYAQILALLIAAERNVALGAAIVLDNVEALLRIATVVGGHGAAAGEELQALSVVGTDGQIVIGAAEVTLIRHRIDHAIQPDCFAVLVHSGQVSGLHRLHNAGAGDGGDKCHKNCKTSVCCTVSAASSGCKTYTGKSNVVA